MLIRADGVTAAWESPHQHTHTNTHRVHHQELNPPASAKENRQASVSKRDTAKYRQLRFDLTLSRHSTQHPAPDGGVVFCAGILPHRRRRQIRNAHLLLASRVETLRGRGATDKPNRLDDLPLLTFGQEVDQSFNVLAAKTITKMDKQNDK